VTISLYRPWVVRAQCATPVASVVPLQLPAPREIVTTWPASRAVVASSASTSRTATFAEDACSPSGPAYSTVPAWTAVIVTSKVTKSGSTIHGDTARIVVVHTGGFHPLLAGWGTVVATVC
jgi:hypothetical protein